MAFRNCFYVKNTGTEDLIVNFYYLFQYSADEGATWVSPSVTSGFENLSIPSGAKYYFKGTGFWFSESGGYSTSFFRSAGKAEVGGCPQSLVHDGDGDDMSQLGKTNLFAICGSAGPETRVELDISNLILPKVMYKNYLYDFFHYSKLTIPNDLFSDIETLEQGCFQGMFSGAEIGSIPETLLQKYTVLKESCYQNMFSLTDIQEIPENLLPVTTLAKSCYTYMFSGCGNLTEVPKNLLKATTLAEYCYSGMFNNCENLTTIHENSIPIAKAYTGCCHSMFCNCKSLKHVPNLFPAGFVLEENPYHSSLRCFQEMFESSGVEDIAGNLFLNIDCSPGGEEFADIFASCLSLKTLPNKVFNNITSSEGCFKEAFADCKNLELLPAGFLDTISLAKNCFDSMFIRCDKLDIPSNFSLPATTLESGCYQRMFAGSGIKRVPKGMLPATDIPELAYSGMFGASDIEVIEDESIMMKKFTGTTNFQSVSSMFSSCNKLTEIHINFDSWIKSGLLGNSNGMFAYLPAAGDFYCPYELEEIHESEHGTLPVYGCFIPDGWTVHKDEPKPPVPPVPPAESDKWSLHVSGHRISLH